MEENYGGQGGRGECVQPRIETKEELETCEEKLKKIFVKSLYTWTGAYNTSHFFF
jgi:hypothetical protein